MTSELIGQEIKFSITSTKIGTGVIIERIDMLNAPDNPQVGVTGYLVEQPDGKIKAIQYWRVLEFTVPSQTLPSGDLPGGYKR
jgi:hypothetical protein